MKVIKRDGTTVDFDRSKIIVALSKANEAVEENQRITSAQMDEIADFVDGKNKNRLLVEDIQDMVEEKLMATGKYELAKTYILYRYIQIFLFLQVIFYLTLFLFTSNFF